MKILPCLIGLALLAAACQPLASPQANAGAQQAEGRALAQAACGGCHAVEGNAESPNPNAPSFARIVNQAGLSADTLSSWLRDAHNYPEEMEFSLEQAEVNDLVSYMLTLRDANYRPPI